MTESAGGPPEVDWGILSFLSYTVDGSPLLSSDIDASHIDGS